MLRVHDWNYIKQVQAKCSAIPDRPESIGRLDMDTAISHDSFAIALVAAGAVCRAVDAVMDKKVIKQDAPPPPPPPPPSFTKKLIMPMLPEAVLCFYVLHVEGFFMGALHTIQLAVLVVCRRTLLLWHGIRGLTVLRPCTSHMPCCLLPEQPLGIEQDHACDYDGLANRKAI